MRAYRIDPAINHMRLAILALVLFAFPVTGCTARVPNMTCKAVDHGVTGLVEGRFLIQPTDTPTDVFRIANGKVYHRWSGREEYFYNDIVETGRGGYEMGHRYMSGLWCSCWRTAIAVAMS
jgi:hypothetical protein